MAANDFELEINYFNNITIIQFFLKFNFAFNLDFITLQIFINFNIMLDSVICNYVDWF